MERRRGAVGARSLLLLVVMATCAVGVTVRFAAMGDYGSPGPREEAVADLVKSWDPDFIITQGDNDHSGRYETIDVSIGQYYASYIYPYHGTYPRDANAPMKNRFFPCLGNHDYTISGAAPCLGYFTGLPGNRRYYDFMRGPVHLFAINSCDDEPDGNTQDSKQAQWLKSALSQSTSPHRVVYHHHPAYTSMASYTGGSNEKSRWPFVDWGATLVLSGHEHLYERLHVENIPYVVNGLGGSTNIDSFGKGKEHPMNEKIGDYFVKSIVQYNAWQGALKLEADEHYLNVTFVNIHGEEIDFFRISGVGEDPVTILYTPPTDVYLGTSLLRFPLLIWIALAAQLLFAYTG